MNEEAQDEKVERLKRVPVKLKTVAEILQQIADDRTVPRNIRAVADESLNALAGEGSVNLRISTAISLLDDIINDPNMPMYTRTQIWNVVSMLEQKGSEIKE